MKHTLGSVVVTAALLIAPAAANAVSRGDAQCRNGLGYGVRRLALHIVRQLELCHKKRVFGRISSNTDCNSLANLPAPKVIARIEESLAQLAKTHCRGASAPITLGFNRCPAPCDGIPMTTYQDVADCLVCTTREQATQSVKVALGTPPVSGPNSAVAECVDAVSKALRKTLAKHVEQQRRCQFLVDRSLLSTGTDCRTADISGVVAREVTRGAAYLARCGVGSRTKIGTCNSARLLDAQLCFTAAVGQHADALMERVYDPLVVEP